MKKCSEVCYNNNVKCPFKECKFWIKYKEDLNCSLISIEKNGSMTLKESSKRLGMSYVNIKIIQDIALNKLRKFLVSENNVEP